MINKVVTVVGNRPQFIKLGNTALRLREMGASSPIDNVVINTGQHYDDMLSDVFFRELEIDPPDYDLKIGSGSIIDQISRMMGPIEGILERERPDAVLVYGDTNSTVAAALVAAHRNVPLIHVEGGERLYRRRDMPEEINRVATDHLSSLCLCSSHKAEGFLRREGFAPSRMRFVGDPMYDIFLRTKAMLPRLALNDAKSFGLGGDPFVLATIHRAENVDNKSTALALLDQLDRAALPVLLPLHPRLAKSIETWGWRPRGLLRLVPPLGYFDLQGLLQQCAIVVSDSGGVNREAFFAGKGCIIPLETSAWTEAVDSGFAVNVGQDMTRLGQALRDFRPSGDVTAAVTRAFGDGDAAGKIIREIGSFLERACQSGIDDVWRPYGEAPIDSARETVSR